MKKSQGEIFGIALMFVVIIVGIILYSQIKIVNPDEEFNVNKEKYEILAESTLNSLLKLSTSCYVERNKDSVIDLIKYCQENTFNEFDEVPISCDNGFEGDACLYSAYILNESLKDLFHSKTLGPTPYLIYVEIPNYRFTLLSNLTLTNFNKLKFKNQSVTQNNYRKLGYNKASSGLRSIPSANREILFELALYYR